MTTIKKRALVKGDDHTFHMLRDVSIPKKVVNSIANTIIEIDDDFTFVHSGLRWALPPEAVTIIS